MQFEIFPKGSLDDCVFFDKPAWQNRTVTYKAGDEDTSGGWRYDFWERSLDVPNVSAEAIFEQARARLISMDVIPDDLLEYTVQWQVENRLPQVNDLLFQRTHLIHMRDFRVLDVLSATRIGKLVDEPNLFMLQYIATEGHPECGRSNYSVIKEDDTVRFTIDTISKPALLLTKLAKPFTRRTQLKITNAVLDYMQNAIRLDLSEENPLA